MSITNQSKNTILATDVIVASTSSARMTGLLSRSEIKPGEALIITKCRSIHMFFMKFAIDVIFVNKSHKIVGLIQKIRPFRLSRIYFKADYCIELPPGIIADTQTAIGDQLTVPYNLS